MQFRELAVAALRSAVQRLQAARYGQWPMELAQDYARVLHTQFYSGEEVIATAARARTASAPSSCRSSSRSSLQNSLSPDLLSLTCCAGQGKALSHPRPRPPSRGPVPEAGSQTRVVHSRGGGRRGPDAESACQRAARCPTGSSARPCACPARPSAHTTHGPNVLRQRVPQRAEGKRHATHGCRCKRVRETRMGSADAPQWRCRISSTPARQQHKRGAAVSLSELTRAEAQASGRPGFFSFVCVCG